MFHFSTPNDFWCFQGLEKGDIRLKSFFFVNKIFLKQSVYVLYIRCKLYAAAVISLRFIVTVYYYIVYMYIPILLKILCIHWT